MLFEISVPVCKCRQTKLLYCHLKGCDESRNSIILTDCLIIVKAEIPEENLQYCGVGLCADDFIQSGNFSRPEQKIVHRLLGCYIGKAALILAYNLIGKQS